MTSAPAASSAPASSASAAAVGDLATRLLGAWQQVLATQHAAIYGYGQLGPYLSDPAQIAQARTLEQAHRATRDALESELVQAGATPAVAQPRYSPTMPVQGPATAQTWALELEGSCAASYRFVLTASAEPEAIVAAPNSPAPTSPAAARLIARSGARVDAMAGLSIATHAAISWRMLLTPQRPTVAFPGD